MKQATQSEDNLQINVAKLLTAYGRHDIVWWCCPNGARVTWKTAKLLKQMGVRKGAADIMLLIDSIFHGLELKTEIGVMSADQHQFKEDIERAGGYCHSAFGIDQAIGVLKGINAFRPNISITTAVDGRGARGRPWDAKAPEADKPTNLSPVKPRRAADLVSPIL
jgi:hypothetical protein